MAEEQDERSISIKLKPVTGAMFSVDFAKSGTVLGLKDEVSKTYDAPPEAIRLIYKGQILKDANTLESYGIDNDHVVHLVKSKTATPGASSSPAQGITSAQLQQAATPKDPLVQHLNSMGLTGEAAEQQATSMRELMSSEHFQNMLADPNVIKMMLEQDPAVKRMIENNPEMQRLLEDPEQLQRMARVMANPSLSREMLRGMDLQLSQIEAMGLTPQLASATSQINQMLEQAQDEVAEEADRRRQEQASNPFAALFSGQTGGVTAAASNPDAPTLPWANTTTTNTTTALPNMMAGGGADFRAALGMEHRDARRLMSQMMQNPATREVMVSQLRQLVPVMLNANPQLKTQLAMMGMGDIETNPETMNRFIDLTTNPQMMEMADQMEALMGRSGGGGGADSLAALLGGGAGAGGLGEGGQGAMPNLDQFAAQFGGLLGLGGGGAAGGGAGGVAGLGGLGLPPPPADPETAYADQLQQLQDMGFWDREQNVRVLVATRGNVNAAVERLLNTM